MLLLNQYIIKFLEEFKHKNWHLHKQGTIRDSKARSKESSRNQTGTGKQAAVAGYISATTDISSAPQLPCVSADRT